MNLTPDQIAKLPQYERIRITPNLVPRLSPEEIIMRSIEEEQIFVREAMRALERQDEDIRQERKRFWKELLTFRR